MADEEHGFNPRESNKKKNILLSSKIHQLSAS